MSVQLPKQKYVYDPQTPVNHLHPAAIDSEQRNKEDEGSQAMRGMWIIITKYSRPTSPCLVIFSNRLYSRIKIIKKKNTEACSLIKLHNINNAQNEGRNITILSK